LKHDIEVGIPSRNFAKPKVGQGNGWIEVGAGSLAHGGTNDKNRSSSHGASHEQTAESGGGQEVKGWVSRIEEINSSEARRDHKDCEFSTLKDIEAPMALECISRRHVQGVRIGSAHGVNQAITLAVPITCLSGSRAVLSE
jgi:hypothetical protein